jgi:uncharacterized protein (UPF0333 family)
MNKKKYWFLFSVVLIFVMIGCYFLGSFTNKNGNQDSYSSFESRSYNSSPSSSNSSQTSKDFSGKTTEQIPQTDNITGKQQKMVYYANIHLQVNNLQLAKNELDKIANQTKATIVSGSETERLDERNIRITYNVPQSQFQTFLDLSKKISDTTPNVQIQGDDASEELVDLVARIKAKKAMESRLLAMMAKATTTNDLLDIENTLGTVQEQLEQLTGRQQYLQHRIAFSTITVEISSTTYQPLQTKYSFLNEISRGFINSCKNLWTGLQLFIIWIAKALPFLILFTIIAIPVLLYFKKRQNK